MENKFKDILLILEKLNTSQILPSYSDLEREHENIDDLERLNTGTLKAFVRLKDIHNLSIDEYMNQIVLLDTQLTTYVWHIEAMRNMIEKFIYYEKFKI